jgi:hypothetical protein
MYVCCTPKRVPVLQSLHAVSKRGSYSVLLYQERSRFWSRLKFWRPTGEGASDAARSFGKLQVGGEARGSPPGSKSGGYQSEKGDKKRAHCGSHYDLTNGRNPCVFRSDGVFGIHRRPLSTQAPEAKAVSIGFSFPRIASGSCGAFLSCTMCLQTTKRPESDDLACRQQSGTPWEHED